MALYLDIHHSPRHYSCWDSVRKLRHTTRTLVHSQRDVSAELLAKKIVNIGEGKSPVAPSNDLINFESTLCPIATTGKEM